MARPRKDQADYFPHFTHHGKTVMVLENRHGLIGYAVWFKILESLAAARGHYIDLNDPTEMEFRAAKLGVDVETVTHILETLAFLGAIDRELWELRVIWSENLVQNLQALYRKRADSVPLRPDPARFRLQSGTETEVSDGVMPQSIAEQSRADSDGITGAENAPDPVGSQLPLITPDSPPAPPPDPVADMRKDLVERWNAIGNGVPRVLRVTPDRTKQMNTRLGEKLFRENYRDILDRVAASSFLRGEHPGKGHENWKVDFDWIIQNEKNYVRVLEGKYDDANVNALEPPSR